MSRPPLALGHHRSVTTTTENGGWVARCRIHDLDGRTRKVERWAGVARYVLIADPDGDWVEISARPSLTGTVVGE